jgi:NAD(P)-dependent dehydrogenase (short-subunit alcohol dehydrogenase family)
MVNDAMAQIASQCNRFDGLIAAAGINHIGDAIDHSISDIDDVMSISYTGVFVSAMAAAKQMLEEMPRLDPVGREHERAGG